VKVRFKPGQILVRKKSKPHHTEEGENISDGALLVLSAHSTVEKCGYSQYTHHSYELLGPDGITRVWNGAYVDDKYKVPR